MNAREKMISARTSLILEEPFFGALALRLALREDLGCGTAWTDGQTLGYDPAFILRLSQAQCVALVAHEVMHCSNGHPWRRSGRDNERWNVAADRAINQILIESKFIMPCDCEVATGAEVGKSAEWIYDRLPVNQQQKKQGGSGKPGNGSGKDQQGTKPSPDPLGEVRDAPAASGADGEPLPTEEEWREATAEAAQAARSRGKLPGALERGLAQTLKPRVDWRSVLRRFIMERAKSDYSWTRPSRRYMGRGLYLPALDSHELGEIAVAVDTSGSIDSVALSQVRAELESIIDECHPAGVTVYYADARVAGSDHFDRAEPITWRPRGGGGTDFRPVFAAVEAQEIAPACLIYISDLQGAFPESAEIPTLWITDSNRTAPVGETVRMS
jgi:predicted metal-dependent peptidase